LRRRQTGLRSERTEHILHICNEKGRSGGRNPFIALCLGVVDCVPKPVARRGGVAARERRLRVVQLRQQRLLRSRVDLALSGRMLNSVELRLSRTATLSELRSHRPRQAADAGRTGDSIAGKYSVVPRRCSISERQKHGGELIDVQEGPHRKMRSALARGSSCP